MATTRVLVLHKIGICAFRVLVLHKQWHLVSLRDKRRSCRSVPETRKPRHPENTDLACHTSTGANELEQTEYLGRACNFSCPSGRLIIHERYRLCPHIWWHTNSSQHVRWLTSVSCLRYSIIASCPSGVPVFICSLTEIKCFPLWKK